MKNHTPLRMCMACRQMKAKSELIRFVKVDGSVVVDKTMKIQSRGAYLCRSKECIDLAKKKRCLQRHLKCDVDMEAIILEGLNND